MRIPVYNRKDIPGAASTSPARNVQAEGSTGRVIAQAGSQLTKIGEAFGKLRDHQQTNQAKVETYKLTADINQRAANDPNIDDPNVQQSYRNEIDKGKATISAGIKSNRAREAFGLEYDMDAIGQQVKIAGYGRKMLIDKTWAGTQEKLLNMRELYTSLTGDDRKAVLESAFHEIDVLADLRMIDSTQAFNEKEKLRKDWSDSAVSVLTANDPEEAIRQITSNEFPEMTQEEKSNAIKVAESAVKRNDKQADEDKKEMWRTNLGELNRDIKSASIQDYLDGINNGTMNPDTCRKMIAYKMSEDSVAYGINEKKKSIILGMMDEAHNPATDLIRFQERISDEVSAGNMDEIKAAEFQLLVEPLFEQAIENKSRPNPFSKAWQSSMDYMKGWVDRQGGGSVNTLYDLSTQFMTKVLTDKVTPDNMAEVAKDLVKSQVRADHPATVALDDVPNSVTSQAGQFKEVYNGDTTQKADRTIKKSNNITQKVLGQIQTADDIAELKADRKELETAGVDVDAILLILGDESGK